MYPVIADISELQYIPEPAYTAGNESFDMYPVIATIFPRAAIYPRAGRYSWQ
jgi:hypothetical protein